MFKIGCHLSFAGGFYKMGMDAVNIGANTFQFFTRNPRGGKAKDINKEDVHNLIDIMSKNNFCPVVAHSPYTVNACSDKQSIRDFAVNTMKDDLQRMQSIPGNMYNFHPGSHVGQGLSIGIEEIADMLNAILLSDYDTTVLLETMSGKGSEVGSSFEELKMIIDKVTLNNKLGICLDTCHVFDAGYDIVNNLDGVINEFDRILGLGMLKAIHLNDSMNPLGSHKDRHQKIGEGYIGLDSIKRIINHEKLRELPFILETPNDLQGYKKEITLLKSLYEYN